MLLLSVALITLAVVGLVAYDAWTALRSRALWAAVLTSLTAATSVVTFMALL